MVWQLQQVHPNRPDAVAFQTALTTIVNTAAESPEAADAAYFELEDMHAKVTPMILRRHCMTKHVAKLPWGLLQP